MSTDDPDADGLMLRLRTVSADVNGSQVDDAFTGKRKKHVTKTFLFPAGCENNHVEEIKVPIC